MADEINVQDSSPEPAPEATSSIEPQAPEQQPQPVDDKPTKLYNALISAGLTKDNIGDMDSFRQKVADPNRAAKLYDQLIKIGFTADNLHGDRNAFVKEISTPAQSSSAQQKIPGIDTKQPSLTEMATQPQAKSIYMSPIVDQDTYDKNSGVSEGMKQYRKIYNELDTQGKQLWDRALTYTKPVDQLREPTKDEIDHAKFMQTAPGKVLGAVAYLGSKATKGTLQIVKGANWAVSLSMGDFKGMENPGAGLEGLEKASDYGLSEGDKARLEDGTFFGTGSKAQLGGNALKNVGTIAEVAPAAELGQATTASKLIFALQGWGQASEISDNLEKSGVQLDPIVKHGFIAATGAVNGLLMGDLGETLYGKIPAEAKAIISTQIAADAIQKASAEGLSRDAIPGLIADGAKTFSDKFATGGIKYLNKYRSTVIDLAKLNAANALLRQGVNKAQGEDVFHDGIGDFVESLNDMVTKQAPLFAGLNKGTWDDAKTIIFKNSGFNNEITTALIKDSSPESVDLIKQKVYDYGFNDPRGQWTPEQMDASFKTIDKLAQTARSLPKTVLPGKAEQALGLLYSRNELQIQLDAVRSVKENADPALKDIPSAFEQTLMDKIDQANDKLASAIRGGRVTYSFDAEKGQAYKNLPDGTREKISDSRYELEATERALVKKFNIVHDQAFQDFAESAGVSEPYRGKLRSPEGAAVDLELNPVKGEDKTVEITNLEVPEETRGLGLAKDRLNTLSEKADEHGITLTAKIGEDVSGGLKKLYMASGFEESEPGVMTRQPKSSTPQEENINTENNEKVNGQNELGQGELASRENGEQKTSGESVSQESSENDQISSQEKEIATSAQHVEVMNKLDKINSALDKHSSGEKELDEVTLQGKKAVREKLLAQKKELESKFDKENESFYAGKESPTSNSKLDLINKKITETKASLSKKIKGNLSSTGPFNATGDLIKLGALYIQRGIIKFSDFVNELKKDYKETTGGDLLMSDKEIASSVFKPAMKEVLNRNDVDPIGKRGFGERMSGHVSDEVQEYIDKNPEHDYRKQVLADIKQQLDLDSEKQRVDKMDELQRLSELTSDTNVGVLAAQKQLEIAIASGDKALEAKTFELLDKAGTTIGQMLRQFGEIKGMTPQFFINAVEKKIANSGRYLTDTQKQDLMDITGDYLKKSIKAKDSFLNFVETLAPKDKSIADTDRAAADMAYIKLVRKQRDFDIQGFWDTASTIMQGNLLTTVSQIANPIYNLAFLPYRTGTKTVAAGIDYVASKLFGLDRTSSISLSQAKESFNGAIEGIGLAYKTAKYGIYPNDHATKIEGYRGLKPLSALVNIFTGERTPQSHDQLQYLKDRYLTGALEGVFGAPAEVMYRLLAFGDKPFYQSAYRAKIAEVADVRGLKGDERTRFLLNPDIKTIKDAMNAADIATFQNDNSATQLATSFTGGVNRVLESEKLNPIGHIIKFAFKSVIPFVKTPTNVIYETASYVMPEISVLNFSGAVFGIRSAMVERASKLDIAEKEGASAQIKANINKKYNAIITEKRGDAINAIAKGMVARVFKAAAIWIVSNGMYGGALDKDKKKRSLQYEAGKPNSINVDGLIRGMQTGKYTNEPGDKLVALDKFGMFGAAVAIQGNVEAQEALDGSPAGEIDILKGAPALLKFALDQSFLKGTNTLLDAITKGDGSQIAPSVAAAMYSVVVPNTWSSLARANREFMVNKKDPQSTWTTIENAIKEKTFFDPKLPSQIGLWGQRVSQTPNGRNPYIYQLLDITKYNNVTEDPVSNEVVKIATATKDPGVIPSQPDENYTIFGYKYKLNATDWEQRKIMVGEENLKVYTGVMASDGFKDMDLTGKKFVFDYAAVMGSKFGNLRFEKYMLDKYPDLLEKGREQKKDDPSKPYVIK